MKGPNMKIAKKTLEETANLNPTKQSQSMTVTELCTQIDNGDITIPMYQRGLSWNDNKAVALFNYQLFGKAPVSPLSFNKIGKNNDVPQLSFVSRKLIKNSSSSKGNLSVVDGQQRLTTNYKAYSNDPSFSHIVLDVTQAKFKKVKSLQHNQIPVGVLLNRDQQEISKFMQKHFSSKEYTDLSFILIGIRNKMLSYMYTVHIANDMNEKEQIEWFEVLNNAGSRISTIDLSLSKLHTHDFDIHKEFIAPYQQEVEKYGFKKLFLPFSTKVSFPIASLNPAYELSFQHGAHNKNYAPIPSDTKENKLTKLNSSELREIKVLTLNGLHRALQFISNNNLQKYITKMTYIMYLTGYFVFCPNESKYDQQLINWVKNTNFTNATNGEKRDIFEKLINNDF